MGFAQYGVLMVESVESGAHPDRAWAGTLRFPRDSRDLRSTSACPACFSTIVSSPCRTCGLDFTHPATAELAALSTRIADDLDARADLIGRIRRETAQRDRALSPREGDAAPAAETEETPSVAGPAPAPSAAPSVDSSGPVGPASAPRERRSSIQIALVIVGVSLLSVFAAFGLVYAFVTFGSTVRMLIIAAGTVATLIAAAVLSRRGLTATAEGIAALGTIVLVLDAWALRLNDPEGLGAVPWAGYWGVALLVVGVIATLWSRWGRLASPAVAAAALLPLGAALASAEFVTALWRAGIIAGEGSVALFVASCVALGVAGLSGAIASRSRPATRRATHVLARVSGATAAVVALGSLVDLQPGTRAAPVIGALILGLLAVAHLVPLARETRARRTAFDTVAAVAIGGGSALAVIIGTILTTLRVDQERVTVSLPLLASVAIALTGEQLWRRSRSADVWRTGFASGTIVAATVAVIGAALAGVIGASAFAEAATTSLRVLPLSVESPVTTPEPIVLAALGALALSAGLVAASWATLGRLRSRLRALGPALGVLIVLAAPLAGAWWLVMLLFGILAVGGVLVLRAGLPRVDEGDRITLSSALAPLIVGAAIGAAATGWAVQRGWTIGLTITLLAIMLARTTTAHRWVRGLALGIATVLVLSTAGTLDRELLRVGIDAGAAAVLVLLAAIVVLTVALGGLEPVERLSAGGVALAAVTLTVVVGPGGGILHSVALAALTAALVVAELRAGDRPTRRAERWASRIAIPGAVTLGILSLPAEVLPTVSAAPVALAALVVIVVAALAASLRRADAARYRLATDITAGVLALGLLVDTLLRPEALRSGDTALGLLIASVIPAVSAVSTDGLLGSSSRRRNVGWLGVVLATAALWVLLRSAEITQLEAFVLPVGGLLLALGALIARARRSDGAGSGAGVASIVSIATAFALLPLAAASGIDSPWRLIIVGVAGAGVALGAVTARSTLDSAFRGLATGLLGVGLATLALLTLAQLVRMLDLSGAGPLGAVEQVRTVLLVTALAATALLVWFSPATRSRDAVAASGAGLAAATAGVAGLLEAVDPVELVSVPLALGLLGIGTLQLGRNERSRSWPWLAPGILALLAPSLLAIDGAGQPLWRAVAVGVVAAALFLLALQRRLQAPFVLAGVTLIVHLLVQSWPLLELVGDAVEWWIWLGLAGVLVVVLAARYERRVQNVRDLAGRIADLR